MEGLILKLSNSRLLELEELLGVVITDVLNHLIDAFHFGNGNFTVFHITAYEVTQRAAEVFICLLYTSPSPRDAHESRMPSSA